MGTIEPDETVGKIAETLGNYGLTRVTGDRYAGEWVPAAFRKHGIHYHPAADEKSAI